MGIFTKTKKKPSGEAAEGKRPKFASVYHATGYEDWKHFSNWEYRDLLSIQPLKWDRRYDYRNRIKTKISAYYLEENPDKSEIWGEFEAKMVSLSIGEDRGEAFHNGFKVWVKVKFKGSSWEESSSFPTVALACGYAENRKAKFQKEWDDKVAAHREKRTAEKEMC